MKHYQAPWSTLLIFTSSLLTVLCTGIAVGLMWNGRGALTWAALVPIAILAGSALFTIRGYALTADFLLIRRLFWTTRLPSGGMPSVQFEPNAMRRSIRTFDNGGLFSFTGLFRSKTLGTYQAFVTDPRRAVVIRLPSGIVVLSPPAPEDFVHDLTAAIPLDKSA